MNKYPWLVRVWNRNGDEYILRPHVGTHGACGGTIIASKYVLTAAHCVDKKNATGWFIRRHYAYELAVKVGDHKIQSDYDDNQGLPTRFINIVKIIQHPDWNGSGKGHPHEGNDVAILELAEELDLVVYTPACLAKASSGDKFNGKTAKAYGWGAISEIPWRSYPDDPYEIELRVRRGLTEWMDEISPQCGGTVLCAGLNNLDRGICLVSRQSRCVLLFVYLSFVACGLTANMFAG